MQKNILIVFSKVPIEGKVKTRIAKYLGDRKALEIHQKLFANTLAVCTAAKYPYTIYLSEKPKEQYPKNFKLQKGKDLGEKMFNAFATELRSYDKVCLIGSDCLELTVDDLDRAFQQLETSDIVFGPANDGGYYLVGMKTLIAEIFHNILWSSSTVLSETIKKCTAHDHTYNLLQTHNDIDRPEDIPTEWR
jgi:rSAM/selenodomain-associated transferase 1